MNGQFPNSLRLVHDAGRRQDPKLPAHSPFGRVAPADSVAATALHAARGVLVCAYQAPVHHERHQHVHHADQHGLSQA